MDIFKDKVAYITGGSKGIGLGIAEALINKDMKVAISGRNLDALKEAQRHLKNSDNLLILQSDVADYNNEVNAVESIIAKWGRLDLVVANAGVGKFSAIDELTSEDWNQVINTNVTGVFNTTKSTIEALKETKGFLITIASLAGTNFFAGGTAYNASKFAVVGFTQAAMLDLRKYEIRVTTIMPGSVATNFNGNIPSDEDSWKIQPEDIGQLVVDLMRMPARTLPSKIEVRPTLPPSSKK